MSDTATIEDAPKPVRHKKKRGFPSTYTILAGVTLAVWLAAFVIPPGAYDVDAQGRPIAGSYHRIADAKEFSARIRDLFLAPVNGLYGIQDAKTSQVAPDLSGSLYGAAAVFLFVLAVGAFITVAFATGALDSGIGRLAFKLRNRSILLIVGIMVVFAIAGTIEGFAEETLGFYALLVPLTLALGYDRMTAVVTGGIALAKVRYDRYVKFIVPLMAILFVLIGVFLAIAAWLG
ncbi:hypothetical protein [Nocardia sp. CA-145437]|uniref:hypothetical protein n=1 Tax=Nocardia sp. CA-145437 TaxID=3239980 RepID=UPI003D965616